jgi:thiamine biosynthesis lipoprotein
MKRCLYIVLLVTVAATPGFSHAQVSDAARAVTFRTRTMGTWASLTLITPDSASVSDLAYESLVVFHRVDSLMSNWTATSEVARINREAAPNEIMVHPEVATVIGFAQRVAEESGGAFDITIEPLVRLWGFIGGKPRIPTQGEITATLDYVGYDKLMFDAADRSLHFVRDHVAIDLGGIAKGYGVDRAADMLREAGVKNALINLSGNMVALGNAVGHPGWNLGIRDPDDREAYVARIRISGEAVATSGDYEQFVDADGKRHGHILDPRSGWSARGLTSVTVVTSEAIVADAWATALFVLGPAEARRVASERDDLAVVLIEPGDDGTRTLWVEEPLRARFVVEERVAALYSVRYF